MGNLTSQQASELAGNFEALAKTVKEYLFANYTTLSPEEKESLTKEHKAIVKKANDMYTKAATLVLDNAGTALADIKSITDKMDKTYKQLKNVQKAIEIAAAVVTLAAAIITENPKAVVSSIGQIGSALST